MDVKTVWKYYLLINLPLLAILFAVFRSKALIGYVIGIVLALIQIWFNFFKSQSLLEDHLVYGGKKIVLHKGMFLFFIIHFIILLIVLKKWGLNGFLATTVPLWLQKVAYMLALKKQ